MRSKASGIKLKQSAEESAVPKLRFSEFQDTEAWTNKKINDVLIAVQRPVKMLDEEEYSLVTVKRRYGGVVSRGMLQGKEIKVKSQFQVNEKDFLISKRQIVHNACGLVPKYLDGSIVSNEYSVLMPKKKNDIIFFSYFSQQPKVSESFLQSSVGIVIEKMRFQLDDWLNREFLFPTLAEQQKIADCLTSLDELIALHSQKLDALRAHKKGLLQQLFPAEGETVPTLRFPEFEGAGEWEKRKIFSLLTRTSNPVDVDLDKMYYQIGVRSHGKGIFHKEAVSGKGLGNKRVFWIEENTFIVNIVFAWEQAVANTSSTEKGMIASHRFPMYKAREKRADVVYVKYFFLTQKGKILLGIASPGGAGRNKTLGRKEFENLAFHLPEKVEEQARIAKCLSSIDELIALQEHKLDALNAHKKGLMQQLFPALDEVRG